MSTQLDFSFSADSSPESASTYLNALAHGQDTSPESPRQTSDSPASQNRPDQAPGARARRKRKKNFTREDRAMHSVVERQRRDAFNQLLSQLSSNIPNQPSTKKQSKSVIVRASIAHHIDQRQRALTASVEIRKLLAERADLLREVNRLRQKMGHGAPRTLDRDQEQIRERDRLQVFAVETENFTDFTADQLDTAIEGGTASQIDAFPEDGAHVQEPFAIPFDAPFASPTPSQVNRLLQHIDSDLLSIAPV